VNSEQKKQKKIIPLSSIATRGTVSSEQKKQKKIIPLGSIATRGAVSGESRAGYKLKFFRF
jgi:hypothetical protein